MKKRMLSLVLLLLVSLPLLFSCGSTEAEAPSGFVLASDPKTCSYRLYVPENWAVQSGSKSNYTMTTIPCDHRCSLSVMVVDNFPEGTVDNFFEQNKAEYETFLNEVTVEEEGRGASVTVGGVAGYRYQFTAKYGERDLRYMQIYIPRNEGLGGYRYYLVTYTADKDCFNIYYDNDADTDILAVLENFSFQ